MFCLCMKLSLKGATWKRKDKEQIHSFKSRPYDNRKYWLKSLNYQTAKIKRYQYVSLLKWSNLDAAVITCFTVTIHIRIKILQL